MMKKLLIFLLLFLSVFLIDFTPVRLIQPEEEKIQVTVKGAVSQEKTIEIPMYSTIGDAIRLVDTTDNADLNALNENMILKDKDVLEIPEKPEETEIRVSINHATREELCQLPGIGESTAQKIIDYRNENGLFQTIEELMNVRGIGEKKFAKLKEFICL